MNRVFVSKNTECCPQNQWDHPTTFPLLQVLTLVKAVAMCVLEVQSVVRCFLPPAAGQCKLSTLCNDRFLRSSNSGWSWWGPGGLNLETEEDNVLCQWPCSYFVIGFLYNSGSFLLWHRYSNQVCCEALENHFSLEITRKRYAEPSGCILILTDSCPLHMKGLVWEPKREENEASQSFRNLKGWGYPQLQKLNPHLVCSCFFLQMFWSCLLIPLGLELTQANASSAS